VEDQKYPNMYIAGVRAVSAGECSRVRKLFFYLFLFILYLYCYHCYIDLLLAWTSSVAGDRVNPRNMYIKNDLSLYVQVRMLRPRNVVGALVDEQHGCQVSNGGAVVAQLHRQLCTSRQRLVYSTHRTSLLAP
jgi:hypothetical protein